MQRAFTVYTLEMAAPDRLRAVPMPDGFRIARVAEPCPELNRFFYTAVGGDWFWTKRLSWTYAQWQAALAAPGHETWIGYWRDTPAGFFEIQPAAEFVDIVFFGLLKQYTGRGLGGAMLSACVAHAWALKPRAVRLSTNTLDSPVALKNYLARGFEITAEQQMTRDYPDGTPGVWPGAARAD